MAGELMRVDMHLVDANELFSNRSGQSLVTAHPFQQIVGIMFNDTRRGVETDAVKSIQAPESWAQRLAKFSAKFLEQPLGGGELYGWNPANCHGFASYMATGFTEKILPSSAMKTELGEADVEFGEHIVLGYHDAIKGYKAVHSAIGIVGPTATRECLQLTGSDGVLAMGSLELIRRIYQEAYGQPGQEYRWFHGQKSEA